MLCTIVYKRSVILIGIVTAATVRTVVYVYVTVTHDAMLVKTLDSEDCCIVSLQFSPQMLMRKSDSK